MVVAPGGIRTNFASNMNITPRHAAYDTPDGALNRLLQFVSNPAIQETWSQPDLCAKVLFDAVVHQNQRPMPSRLLMGSETIAQVRAKIQRELEEVEAWKEETCRCSTKVM